MRIPPSVPAFLGFLCMLALHSTPSTTSDKKETPPLVIRSEEAKAAHELEEWWKEARRTKCSRCDLPFPDKQALDKHIKSSPCHFTCKDCDRVREYLDFELGWHYKHCHAEMYCHLCKKHFSAPTEREAHFENFHPRCEHCHKACISPALIEPCYQRHRSKEGTQAPIAQVKEPTFKSIIDHHENSGICCECSHMKILTAGKEICAREHPNLMRWNEVLFEEAQKQIDEIKARVR